MIHPPPEDIPRLDPCINFGYTDVASVKNSDYAEENFSLYQEAPNPFLKNNLWVQDDHSTRSKKKNQMADVISHDGFSNFDGFTIMSTKKPNPADFPQNQQLTQKPTQDTSAILAPTLSESPGGLFSKPGMNATALRKRRPGSTLDFHKVNTHQMRDRREILDELRKPKDAP